MNLYKMFDEAKRRCLARLRDFTCARIPLPWAAAIVDEIAAGYGPDPYPYGIEESRPTLEAFCRYAHDQGVTHRRMASGGHYLGDSAGRDNRRLPGLSGLKYERISDKRLCPRCAWLLEPRRLI